MSINGSTVPGITTDKVVSALKDIKQRKTSGEDVTLEDVLRDAAFLVNNRLGNLIS